MVILKEESGAWSLKLPSFEPQLQKGMMIAVDPANVSPRPEDGKPVQCTVVGWIWKIDAELGTTLEISVKQKRPAWIDRHLKTDGSRFNASVVLSFFLVFAGWLCYELVRENPEAAWAFAGHYVRGTVGWGTFFLFSFGIPLIMRWNRIPGFGGFFRQSLTQVVGYVLIGLWLYEVAPTPGGSVDRMHRAQGMVNTFSHSYWPVILAGLPWLLVLLKLFGVERAEKTASALLEAGKKHAE